MKKVNKLRFPEAWRDLRPDEFMFSKKPFHELELIRDQLKMAGIRVSLIPTTGGYHVHCESREDTPQ